MHLRHADVQLFDLLVGDEIALMNVGTIRFNPIRDTLRQGQPIHRRHAEIEGRTARERQNSDRARRKNAFLEHN